MTKRVRLELLPKTPGGRHIKRDEIFADEVEIDDEITVKSSMFRECVPGNPWFEGEDESEENTEPPKYVVRKSVDLRRIRSLKDRVEAIRSSPMVDARPRRSQSFIEGVRNDEEALSTPLRLPNPKDSLHTTCRRLSRIILDKHSLLRSPGVKSPSTQKTPKTDQLLEVVQFGSLQVPGSTLSPANPSTPFSKLQSTTCRSVTSPKSTDQPQPAISKSKSPLASVNSPDHNPTSASDPDSVSGFRMLAEMEQARLNILCDDWNSVMLEEAERIPEQAIDSIRTTVCKCRLVLQKKMPFFLSLVDMAEQSAKSASSPSSEFKENQPPKTDVNDLAGYWALVADEIVQADAAFERLRVWRDEGQWEPSSRPVTPIRAPVKQTRKSKPVKPSVKPVSKIPIKQTLVGRRIDAGTLPVEITKAISEAVKKSNKKPKVPVRSKLAEFLKSKRMETQGASAVEVGRVPEVQKDGRQPPPDLKSPTDMSIDSPASKSRTQSSHIADQPVTPARITRGKKSISFAPDLAHTPGGHQFGSGSPRDSYPLTPANKSGSLVAADRVLRRRRNFTDVLTPLGLQPVSRRSRGTPKVLN